MADVEVIEFSSQESDLIGNLLQKAFEMVDEAGGSSEVLMLFSDLLDAIDNGDTVEFRVDYEEEDDGSDPQPEPYQFTPDSNLPTTTYLGGSAVLDLEPYQVN